MSARCEVVSVNVSREKGTVKRPVEHIVIDARGVVGDAHAGAWHRQVSILGEERIEAFAREAGRRIEPGEFAENVTIRGVELARVAPLDRFRIGDVELEVTQIGKECHGEECAIFREVGTCLMPSEGVFCRVVSGGTIRAGDEVAYEARPLRFFIITLSDRAFAGEYEDRSGPRVRELVEEFFAGKRWHLSIEAAIVPDEPDKLRAEVEKALAAGADVIITCGGTGVGPRMEHIRVKFGAEKPTALLSRSVAGVIGTTQVYAIPGSVKAVAEYMGEILKTLEHIVFMLHGVDVH